MFEITIHAPEETMTRLCGDEETAISVLEEYAHQRFCNPVTLSHPLFEKDDRDGYVWFSFGSLVPETAQEQDSIGFEGTGIFQGCVFIYDGNTFDGPSDCLPVIAHTQPLNPTLENINKYVEYINTTKEPHEPTLSIKHIPENMLL